MVMLNRVINSIIFASFCLTLAIRCSETNHGSDEPQKNKSESILGKQRYQQLRELLKDTFNGWVKNQLQYVSAELKYPHRLDSLLCINNEGDKLITFRHLYVTDSDVSSDDLQAIYGIKINNRWYFLKGENYTIPRSLTRSDNMHYPLSYQELHKIAIDRYYKNYLDNRGNVNPHFFDVFLVDPYNLPAPDKKTLEYRYISYCKGIWSERYAPYKKEDISFNYDSRSRSAKVSFRLTTYDSVYLPPVGYKIIYKTKDMKYVDNACGANWCEVNWNKTKIASGTIPNIPPGSEVEIYIELDLYYDHRTKRLGPFIFKAEGKNFLNT